MKRTTLITASLLLVFAGCTCGQGWRPNIFSRMRNAFHGTSNVGEPCDACHHGYAETTGCETCGSGNVSNYGGYEGEVIGSYEGTPVGTSYVGTAQPYNSQTFPSNTRRVEPVQPRPSN